MLASTFSSMHNINNMVADDMVLFKIQIFLVPVLEGMVVPGDQVCLVSCWLTVNP